MIHTASAWQSVVGSDLVNRFVSFFLHTSKTNERKRSGQKVHIGKHASRAEMLATGER